MKIESLIHITFTEKEVVSALLVVLNRRLRKSELSVEDFNRRRKILDHLNGAYVSIDVDGDKFHLMADGIAITEEF